MKGGKKMGRLGIVLLGVAIGGAFVYSAFSYHLVRTDAEFLVVRKSQSGLEDCYADIRDWEYAEWKEHPELIDAMQANGHGDLVVGPRPVEIIKDVFDHFRSDSNQAAHDNDDVSRN